MDRSNYLYRICEKCLFRNDEKCKPMENGYCIYYTCVDGLAFPEDKKTDKEVEQNKSKCNPPMELIELGDAWTKLVREVIRDDDIIPVRSGLSCCLSVVHFWHCLEEVVAEENPELIQKAYDLKHKEYPED